MPREKQDALLHEREVCGFLEQSRISEKNIARLRTLAQSTNANTAELAAIVLEVARVAPYRRRRIRMLARQRSDLLKRMAAAGLIWEETDPDDIDLEAAWDEWVEFAKGREADVDFSATLESAVKEELASAHCKEWRNENREAIQAYNEHVEKHGTFSDDVRSF